MMIDLQELLAKIKPYVVGWIQAMGGSGTGYVLKAGDTMTGALNLPSNGLAVGTNQLVVSSSNVGISKANPGSKFHVLGDIRLGDDLTSSPFWLNLTSAGGGGIYSGVRFGTEASPALKWSIYGSTADSNLYVDMGASNAITILNTGYIGFGTSTPTAQFSVSEKVGMSADGGIMVKLTNKTGANTVKGEVVHANSAQNNSVVKIVVDVPDPIGVFYESGVADGSEAWVVVSGIADVYFVGNTTRGHVARGFVTADGASYVTGQALSEAVPSSPFATDKHFYEIGHVLESRTGAGLAKCVLHFN